MKVSDRMRAKARTKLLEASLLVILEPEAAVVAALEALRALDVQGLPTPAAAMKGGERCE